MHFEVTLISILIVNMVDNVSDIRVEPIQSSKYLQPMRLHYKQDGRNRYRDYFRSHDRLAIDSIFNRLKWQYRMRPFKKNFFQKLCFVTEYQNYYSLINFFSENGRFGIRYVKTEF